MRCGDDASRREEKNWGPGLSATAAGNGQHERYGGMRVPTVVGLGWIGEEDGREVEGGGKK